MVPAVKPVEVAVVNEAGLGTHCLLDLFGCRSGDLDDPDRLVDMLTEAASRAGATVLSAHQHRFEPHGVSALCVLSESHISIHTWPEFGTASADVYTCGEQCDPDLACDWIEAALQPTSTERQVLRRGVSPSTSGR